MSVIKSCEPPPRIQIALLSSFLCVTMQQAASSGGRVHAIIHRAVNLPDLDNVPQSGLSDPYVKLVVSSTVVTSTVVNGTLNPVRNKIATNSCSRNA